MQFDRKIRFCARVYALFEVEIILISVVEVCSKFVDFALEEKFKYTVVSVIRKVCSRQYCARILFRTKGMSQLP